MSIFPKLIYRFKAIPIKIPARFFVDNDKLIQKVIKKGRVNRMAQVLFRKKNKNGEIASTDF